MPEQSDQPLVAEAPRGASRTRPKQVVPEQQDRVESVDKHTWRFSVSWQTDWWLKPVSLITAVVVFAVLFSSATEKLYVWLDQPVSQLTVTGQTRYLQKAELASSSLAAVDGGLMSADIQKVKAQAQSHPWVYQVNVERRWPGSLVLDVKEEVPVARWAGNGLLNHEGDIFWPDKASQYQHLPLLEGPSSNTIEMMEQYYQLNQRLRALGLQVSSLQLEARGAWSLTLDNDVVLVLGREDLIDRLERFVSIYEIRLKDDMLAGRVAQVDVRYDNGVAVTWREVAETEQPVGAEVG